MAVLKKREREREGESVLVSSRTVACLIAGIFAAACLVLCTCILAVWLVGFSGVATDSSPVPQTLCTFKILVLGMCETGSSSERATEPLRGSTNPG